MRTKTNEKFTVRSGLKQKHAGPLAKSAKKLTKNKDKENKPFFQKINLLLSVCAIVIAFFTLFFSFILPRLNVGKVNPLEPTGYSIIRGIESFPSDHIVIPIEWENTYNHSVLIREMSLVLRELDNKNNETKTAYIFPLAGEYQDISTKSFNDIYSYKQSIILEPNSLTEKYLVFLIFAHCDPGIVAQSDPPR